MRGCDVTAPVDREQHFFLHVFSVGGVILPAGQMAEVRPHGRADRFQRFDCMLAPGDAFSGIQSFKGFDPKS